VRTSDFGVGVLRSFLKSISGTSGFSVDLAFVEPKVPGTIHCAVGLSVEFSGVDTHVLGSAVPSNSSVSMGGVASHLCGGVLDVSDGPIPLFVPVVVSTVVFE